MYVQFFFKTTRKLFQVVIHIGGFHANFRVSEGLYGYYIYKCYRVVSQFNCHAAGGGIQSARELLLQLFQAA